MKPIENPLKIDIFPKILGKSIYPNRKSSPEHAYGTYGHPGTLQNKSWRCHLLGRKFLSAGDSYHKHIEIDWWCGQLA